jgi:predicted O-methyltransferase YrrM
MPTLNHPIFSLVGLRPVGSQHTDAEDAVLRKYAQQAKSIVEIGVAEGASAASMRSVTSSDTKMYLIDPYCPGRVPGFNAIKVVAHRHVQQAGSASIAWLEDFSFNVVKTWNTPIDFLFIDGDHSYEGCRRDWNEWNQHVVKGGFVAFHDSRFFPGGWPTEDTGSLRVVTELFRDTQNATWDIVDEADSITVIRKK